MVIFASNPVHCVLFLIVAFFNAAGLFLLLGAEFLAMVLVIVYVGAVAVLFLFVVMMLNITAPKKPPVLIKHKFHSFFRAFLRFLGGVVCFLLGGKIILSILKLGLQSTTLTSLAYDREWVLYIISACLSYYSLRSLLKMSLFKLTKELIEMLSPLWLLGIIILGELIYTILNWQSFLFKEKLVFAPILSSSQATNTHALGKIIYTDYIFLLEIVGFILLVAIIGAIVLTHRKREEVKHQGIQAQLKRSKKETLKLHDIPLRKGV